ncbi:MAG: adenosylmethionine decarboxylase [Candidatus Micrarchaeia archaeon]
MYGPHLMLDCYGCNKKKLGDLDYIYKFLDAFPALIGMHKIMPPVTTVYESQMKPEDWGISGVVLIAESHISVHTYPEKRYVVVDVFSCKDFDIDEAAIHIASAFDAKRYEKSFLWRGREFPKDMAEVGRIVSMQRKRLL